MGHHERLRGLDHLKYRVEGTVRVLHFGNLQMIKEVVRHRVGITPVRFIQPGMAQGRLVPVPIEGTPLFRPLGILHRKKKPFHRAARACLELLRENPAQVPVRIE